MKNFATIARVFLVFVILTLLLASFAILSKNRASGIDYINYACLVAIVLAALAGGITFAMLVALVIIFAQSSLLIVNYLSLGIPISFTVEQGLWYILYIFSSIIAGMAGNKIKFMEEIGVL